MKTAATLIAIVAVAAIFTGCGNSKSVSYASISNNLTPEMHSLTQSPIEYYSDTKVTANSNLRLFWDDFSHVWYTNSPSKLSPYPITVLSGQPR